MATNDRSALELTAHCYTKIPDKRVVYNFAEANTYVGFGTYYVRLLRI